MEERKRTLLAVVISCIILIAVLYSFGLNFFRSTPEIVVADPNVSSAQPVDPDGFGEQGGITVAVTPETVQSIIASMSRYKSYSRTVEIWYGWGTGQSGKVTAQVYADNGWSRCDTVLASGMTEHSITGDGTLWFWYDDGTAYVEEPAQQQTEDLMQHIPTYEDVLALDPASIMDCGYEIKDGASCIFVEAKRSEFPYTERYWIAVGSGLLIAAETEKNGGVVYAMSSGDIASPMSSDGDVFSLPDGTVLHVPQN